jgi:cysteine-rich repeat protein
LSLSPNDAQLVTGGHDNSIYFWDTASGRVMGNILQAHAGATESVDFDPTGRWVASGGADQMVKLWSLGSGPWLSSLHGGLGVPFPGQESESVRYLAAFHQGTVSVQRPYTWRPNCGDGVVDEGELFDNGQPWEGGEYVASCGATCGDGVVQNGEACDDGNDSNDDACPNTCQAHRCGDGIVRQDLQPGEAGYESCDDENTDDYDGCGRYCNRCGDGVVGVFETCDDGNEVDQDGCTDCALDTCGDGQVNDGERCDDGNREPDDACSQRCTFTQPRWVAQGRRVVSIMVGNCNGTRLNTIPCSEQRPAQDAGAGVGDQLAVVQSDDVISKYRVGETEFIQGSSGRLIDPQTLEIRGAVGCGGDRLVSREAEIWECRY